MNLDLRTMVVMISALSLMMSGLIALAGLHPGHTRGAKLWALASLSISAGLGFAILPLTPENAGGWILGGATLFAAGTGLQYSGIRTFLDKETGWRIPLLVVALVFVQTAWSALIHPDIRFRSIANSLVFAAVDAACARMLLVRVRSPLRTAYWLTGISFAALAAMFLVRALDIAYSSPQSYGLYAQLPINQITFFLASIAQLSLGFGFVLMLNYRLADELEHLAARDFLTGAFNRRSLEQEASQRLLRCTRKNETLTAMMVDVDHFKKINDRFGHAAGDEVLRRLAVLAQGVIRTGDYFARYGGEEFCILLDSVTRDQAWRMAERLREVYAGTSVRFGDEAIHSTISIGVADSGKAGDSLSRLFGAADEALYRAKQEGRNRVEIYSDTL